MEQSTRPWLPFRLLLRVPVPWVFVLAYLLGAGLQHVLPHTAVLAERQRVLNILGAGLWLAAVAIAGWALLLFRRRRTTTTPGEISEAFVALGPYRVSRNPMYVGLVLAYLGEMCWLAQIAPAVTLALTVAYLQWVVIPLEETTLLATFREDYAEYLRRVRRWL